MVGRRVGVTSYAEPKRLLRRPGIKSGKCEYVGQLAQPYEHAEMQTKKKIKADRSKEPDTFKRSEDFTSARNMMTTSRRQLPMLRLQHLAHATKLRVMRRNRRLSGAICLFHLYLGSRYSLPGILLVLLCQNSGACNSLISRVGQSTIRVCAKLSSIPNTCRSR